MTRLPRAAMSLGLAAATWAAVAPAAADPLAAPPACPSRADINQLLTRRFDEVPAALGLQGSDPGLCLEGWRDLDDRHHPAGRDQLHRCPGSALAGFDFGAGSDRSDGLIPTECSMAAGRGLRVEHKDAPVAAVAAQKVLTVALGLRAQVVGRAWLPRGGRLRSAGSQGDLGGRPGAPTDRGGRPGAKRGAASPRVTALRGRYRRGRPGAPGWPTGFFYLRVQKLEGR